MARDVAMERVMWENVARILIARTRQIRSATAEFTLVYAILPVAVRAEYVAMAHAIWEIVAPTQIVTEKSAATINVQILPMIPITAEHVAILAIEMRSALQVYANATRVSAIAPARALIS
jgi:hypothetical protein